MALTREEVEELALLARVALTAEEVEALRGELGAILDHMAVLREVDTTGVEPMTHAVPMTLRLRADVPGPSLTQDEALAGAPRVADGHFVVPAIIPSDGGAGASVPMSGWTGVRAGPDGSES